MYIKKTLFAALAVAGFTATGAVAADKITLALPGVPPVFSGSSALIAEKAGLFKKYGVDVTIKFMDSGAAAAKAVVSGNIDLSMSPTQFVVRLVSNSGAKVKGIWGLDNSDWLIGSMDPKKANCEGMKAGAVGVDSKGGARWIQLNTILLRKCKLKIDRDVKTVPLSSNVGTAMAAGQINFGVLHIDDIPAIEKKGGKKVHIFETLEKVSPDIHYLTLIARQETLEKKSDAVTRVVAALRDAAAMIHDPAQLDNISKMVGATKRPPDEAKVAFQELNKLTFWPKGTVGLDRKRMEGAIKNQVRVGKITKGRAGINPSKTPVTYDQFVDLKIWEAAKKLK